MKKRILPIILLVTGVSMSQAASVNFTLDGLVGTSLLTGNEVHFVSTGGSGGIAAGGIHYNTSTRILNIDVDWGSGNGFTDLSGVATGVHLHGPTGPIPSAFTHTAGILYDLSAQHNITVDTSALSGGVSGFLTIDSLDESALLGGQTYLNVHTTLNSSGEIRGQLVPTVVPEPHEWGLCFGGGLLALVVYRRRRAVVALGVLLFALVGISNVEAQVLWNFSTSDGSDTLTGQITTNGTFADTQGTGSHTFTGLTWDSFYLNGQDQSGSFVSGDPVSFDPSAFNTFVWSRDSQSVTSLSGLILAGTDVGPTSNSQISWTLPNVVVSSTLIDMVDNLPNANFLPTVSSMTPVPEPSEYAVLAGIALLGLAVWRRMFVAKYSTADPQLTP